MEQCLGSSSSLTAKVSSPLSNIVSSSHHQLSTSLADLPRPLANPAAPCLDSINSSSTSRAGTMQQAFPCCAAPVRYTLRSSLTSKTQLLCCC